MSELNSKQIAHIDNLMDVAQRATEKIIETYNNADLDYLEMRIALDAAIRECIKAWEDVQPIADVHKEKGLEDATYHIHASPD